MACQMDTHVHWFAPLLSYTQWLKSSPEEVKEHIYKLAKKGLTPSQIGKLASTDLSDQDASVFY